MNIEVQYRSKNEQLSTLLLHTILTAEFVDGQTIGQLTGEFVDGQKIGQLTGEFVDGQKEHASIHF